MSETNLIKERTEFNRVANRIADLNLNIDMFIKKFEHFQKDFNNVIDVNLFENLIKICNVVDEYLEKQPEDIKTHKKTVIDFDFTENYIKNVFVCDICNFEIGSKYKHLKEHINDKKHIKLAKKKKNRDTNSQNLTSDPTENQVKNQNCNSNKNNAKESTTKERSRQKKGEGDNLPKRAKKFISEDFSEFLTNAAIIGDKLKNIPAYEELAESLINLINEVYPNVTYKFFGSRVNGLGEPNSDLDIFLNIGNVFNNYDENKLAVNQKLDTVHKILSKNLLEWKSLVRISKARVPILSVYNVKYQIDCDIAFSNGLGPCNTLLMRHFFELQPLCHKMCLFMKKWVKLTNLKTNFSTYTATLMVLYYLQINSILPSVKSLQEGMQESESLMIGPWQGDFIKKQLKELNLQKHDDSYESVRNHLIKFFKFYVSFDYGKYVICPYLGFPVEKKIFNTEKNPLKRYYNYYLQDVQKNSFHIDKIMCIADPLEQNHNVAKGITSRLLNYILHYFKLSFKELEMNN